MPNPDGSSQLTDDLIALAADRVTGELLRLQVFSEENGDDAAATMVNYVAFLRARKQIAAALTDAKKAWDEAFGERAAVAARELRARRNGQLGFDDWPAQPGATARDAEPVALQLGAA